MRVFSVTALCSIEAVAIVNVIDLTSDCIQEGLLHIQYIFMIE